jgi:hypothetical protein
LKILAPLALRIACSCRRFSTHGLTAGPRHSSRQSEPGFPRPLRALRKTGRSASHLGLCGMGAPPAHGTQLKISRLRAVS